MNVPVPSAVTAVYRVEVSGWDRSQSFFVEKAELEWGDSGCKLGALRHEIKDGSVLFVRLLLPVSPDRAHPVPYTVEPLGEARLSRWEYRLTPVVPRPSQREQGEIAI